MSSRSVSLSAMFGWIPETFRLVGRGLPSFAGASALTIVLGFAMMIPVWLITGLNPMDPASSAMMATQPAAMLGKMLGASTLVLVLYLTLYPPIVLGWARLCRRVDEGTGASALDIFSPYREGATWIRSIGLALAVLLVFALVLVLFALAFWGTIMQLVQSVAAQHAGATPSLPAGLGALVLGYFLLIAVIVLLQWMQMIAFTEVGLRPTGVLAALGRAIAGLLANVLKLLVFGFCLFVAFLVLMVVFIVLVTVFGSALSLLGPKSLMVGVFLIEMPLLLVMYPLMFAGGYCMWKSLLGDAPDQAGPPIDEGMVAA